MACLRTGFNYVTTTSGIEPYLLSPTPLGHSIVEGSPRAAISEYMEGCIGDASAKSGAIMKYKMAVK